MLQSSWNLSNAESITQSVDSKTIRPKINRREVVEVFASLTVFGSTCVTSLELVYRYQFLSPPNIAFWSGAQEVLEVSMKTTHGCVS